MTDTTGSTAADAILRQPSLCGLRKTAAGHEPSLLSAVQALRFNVLFHSPGRLKSDAAALSCAAANLTAADSHPRHLDLALAKDFDSIRRYKVDEWFPID